MPDLSNFILTRKPADTFGMPIGHVSENDAADMRVARRAWARERERERERERGATVSVKIPPIPIPLATCSVALERVGVAIGEASG